MKFLITKKKGYYMKLLFFQLWVLALQLVDVEYDK